MTILRKLQWLGVIAVTALLIASACLSGKYETEPTSDDRSDLVEQLYQKDSVVILLTDSGLGGLSVVAAIEDALRQHHPFRNVRLVFANALPGRDHTYNRMESTAEKIQVFSAALEGMQQLYAPDIILIACNTLSVVYPLTEFSKSTSVPVVDIVGFGVELMSEQLKTDSTCSMVIVGTPTTIDQGTHRDSLLSMGIDSGRIITQACEMLESEIQSDPASDIVTTMIDMYAWEALEGYQISPDDHLFVALCCTHYGFAASTFQSGFQSVHDGSVEVLDPNIRMGEFLVPQRYRDRYESCAIEVEITSKAEILPEEITSIAGIIRLTSPAVADGLEGLKMNPSLFSF